MRQLLEFAAFNLSKVSKHELDINVLNNEEMCFLIDSTLNFHTVVSNPEELTNRLISENEYEDVLKININSLDLYSNYELEDLDKIKKELKIKMKKYTHYTLLNYIVNKYKYKKEVLIKEINNFKEKKEELELKKNKLELKNNKIKEYEELKKINMELEKIISNYSIQIF